MTPPREVCPHPGTPADPASTLPCALWNARQRVQFQRAVAADAAKTRSMAELVWQDNRGFHRPTPSPTRPLPLNAPKDAELPESPKQPVTASRKGATNHA